MSTPKHPSADLLCAFFDNQTSPAERGEIETHLSGCTDCAATLNDFSRLDALGPLIEEALPTSAYFEDLPDRVLARIAMEERNEGVAAAVAANEPTVSLWKRLLNPVGAWRWASATAVVGLLVAGGVMRAQGPADEMASTPEGTPAVTGSQVTGEADAVPGIDLATNRAAPASDSGQSEEPYARRIFDTLGGGGGNMGTLIDVIPTDEPSGARRPATGANSPITRVSGSIGGPDVIPSPTGANEAGLNAVYEGARRAELIGNTASASRGYQIIHNSTEPGGGLRRAADLGLLRLEWREQIRSAGPESLSTLQTLFNQADRMFTPHLEGDHRECTRAWELHAAYLEVAKGRVPDDMLVQVQRRMIDLQKCFESGVVR